VDDSNANWIRNKEKSVPKRLDEIREDYETEMKLKDQGLLKKSIIEKQEEEKNKINKIKKDLDKEKNANKIESSNKFDLLNEPETSIKKIKKCTKKCIPITDENELNEKSTQLFEKQASEDL